MNSTITSIGRWNLSIISFDAKPLNRTISFPCAVTNVLPYVNPVDNTDEEEVNSRNFDSTSALFPPLFIVCGETQTWSDERYDLPATIVRTPTQGGGV